MINHEVSTAGGAWCPPFRFAFRGTILCLVLSFLVACTKEDSVSSPVKDTLADSHLREAEEHYQQKRFAQAMLAYEQALALDSSLSMAYYGHAKAAIGFHGIDALELYQEFQSANNTGNLSAFLDHPDTVLTRRLQASGRVRRMLGMLADRDSLTRWHAYVTEDPPSPEALGDPLYGTRRAFMIDYLDKALQGIPGYRPARAFPLSDRKIAASAVATEYVMFEMIHTITRIYDFDRNDTIDARDSVMKRLSGGLTVPPVDSLSAADSTALLDSLLPVGEDRLCALLPALCVDSTSNP